MARVTLSHPDLEGTIERDESAVHVLAKTGWQVVKPEKASAAQRASKPEPQADPPKA